MTAKWQPFGGSVLFHASKEILLSDSMIFLIYDDEIMISIQVCAHIKDSKLYHILYID